MSSPLHHAITLRISLSFALLALCVFSALGIYLGQATDAHMADLDEHELRSKLVLIEHIAAQEDSPTRFSSRLADVLIGEHNTLVSVRSSERQIFQWPESSQTGFAPLDARTGLQHQTVDGREYRVLSATVDGDWGERMQVVVGRGIGHHTDFLRELRKDFWLAVLAAALLTALLGSLIARQGMAPVRTLTQVVRRITAGRLAERIPNENVPLELADLVSSFNGMLGRLEESFGRLSDFSADLAHELRTPIHTLRMQTEVLLNKPRQIEEYRDLLASNLEEYERLSRIIADMLFLAKADHGLLIPQRNPVDLQVLCQRLTDYYGILADTRPIYLHTEPVSFLGDELMLERALGNLLVNAIQHTPEGGEVDVQLSSENGKVKLSISNTGIPIPPQLLPGIFGRFVRLDSGTEGAGLGLAITKSIILAHGGEVSALSDEQRTSFYIFLPESR